MYDIVDRELPDLQSLSHNLHVRRDQPTGEDTSFMPTITATKKQDNERLTRQKSQK
jgi:hypothetical protein